MSEILLVSDADYGAARTAEARHEMVMRGSTRGMLEGRGQRLVVERHGTDLVTSLAWIHKGIQDDNLSSYTILDSEEKPIGAASVFFGLTLGRQRLPALPIAAGIARRARITKKIDACDPNVFAWIVGAETRLNELTQVYGELGKRAFNMVGDRLLNKEQHCITYPWTLELPGTGCARAIEQAGFQYKDMGKFDDGEQGWGKLPETKLYVYEGLNTAD